MRFCAISDLGQLPALTPGGQNPFKKHHEVNVRSADVKTMVEHIFLLHTNNA